MDWLSERLNAKQKQQEIEHRRLQKHEKISQKLKTVSAKEQREIIEHAQSWVKRWQQEGTCSRDYIIRWNRILRKSPEDIASIILSDMEGWGNALRQNSPWIGLEL